MAQISSFPNNRDVLWDRTPTCSPCFMRATDMIPTLSISLNNVNSLLNDIYSNSNSNSSSSMINRIGVIITLDSQLKSNTSSMLLLSLQDNNIKKFIHSINIPIEIRPTSSSSSSSSSDKLLVFNKDATSDLIIKLSQTIKSGKDYSLQSCIQIRGACYYHQSDDNDDNDNGITGSTIRFEAIIPNVFFQAVQINPIPILSTPLSLKLARPTESQSLGPYMGYLTMNKTRKLVPLLEIDGSVATTPIVGVWVSLQDVNKVINNNGNTTNGITTFDNPFLWSACVRFLYADKIQDRAYVSQDTFLLVVFNGSTIDYYEMTRLPRSLRSHESDLINVDDFLCTDCSIDLSSNDSEEILCKFRPLTKVDHIRSFSDLPINKAKTATRRSSLDTPVVIGKEISKSDIRRSMNPFEQQSSQFESPAPKIDDAFMDPTPLPRKDAPSPFPSPTNPFSNRRGDSLSYSAGSFSNVVSAAQLSNDMPPQEAEDIGLHIKNNEKVYSFPAEVIVSQQMQLESLRRQVEDLRELVLSLGGKLPEKEKEKVPSSSLSSSSSSSLLLLSHLHDEINVKDSIKSLKIDNKYDDEKFRSSREDFRRVDESVEDSVETSSVNNDDHAIATSNDNVINTDVETNNNDEEDDLYNDTSIAMSMPVFDNFLNSDNAAKRKSPFTTQRSSLGSFSINSSLSYDSVIPTIQAMEMNYDDYDDDNNNLAYSGGSLSSYKRDDESIRLIESKYLSQK